MPPAQPGPWTPSGGTDVWIYKDPGPVSLRQITQELREMVDLPVGDVASLCGVGRRQFYNLLEGATGTNSERERRHIRLVHGVVGRLAESCGRDRRQLRSAMLMPLRPTHQSFFDVAASQDPEAIAAAVKAIEEKLRGATH